MPERRRTRAEERVDEIDVSPTALLAVIDSLTAERDAATKVSEDYLVALQRERAEFLNFKRRTAEERDRDLGLAAEDLIRKVLNLADDFDRAIEARPASIAGDPARRWRSPRTGCRNLGSAYRLWASWPVAFR